MSKVISIAMEKGGVAKTTSVYNLACSRSLKMKERVLMIDLDCQCSLTSMCGMNARDPEYEKANVKQLFKGNIDPADCCILVDSTEKKLEGQHLFIVPGSKFLPEVMEDLVLDPETKFRFKKNIDTLRKYFHTILIDCPPALDLFLTSALIASDSVLYCCKPEGLSYEGLTDIEENVDRIIEKGTNPNLKKLGLIITMNRPKLRAHQIYVEKACEEYNVVGIVPESGYVSNCYSTWTPVVLAHPNSEPAKIYNEIAKAIKAD